MARDAATGQHRRMLLSDMREEPENDETRAARAMLRRMWWILTLSALPAFLLILRPA